MKRKVMALALATAMAASVGLVGCTNIAERVMSSDTAATSTVSQTAATVDDSAYSTVTSPAASMTAIYGDTAYLDVANMDLEYSKRDQNADYDDAAATHITLSGNSASADKSAGVAIDGSTVTISAEGTYVITGTLTDGQIAVDATSETKVQLVLDGVTITNNDGPAIYIKQADKCFITLAAGSTNTLADGATYTLEAGEDEPDAVIFSKDDLTINGSGSLVVTASYADGIKSKDDLVITGGTFDITAVEDCLQGKDCVKILDGTFTLDAGGDAIKSSKEEDGAKGFVLIDGGTFDISAGDEGIQAVSLIAITGGRLTIDSDDDAINSDIEAYVSGGSITITAVDDAIHAEFGLTIDGGIIDIETCEEALEAQVVRINDGDITIYALDDGINASEPELYTEASSDTSSSSSGWGGMDNGPVPGVVVEGCLIEINGGTVDITMAQGDTDAIDSNADIVINGGTVIISAQSAFDYERSGVINGGTVTVNGSQVTTMTNAMEGGFGGGMGGQPGGGFGGGTGGQPGGPMR